MKKHSFMKNCMAALLSLVALAADAGCDGGGSEGSSGGGAAHVGAYLLNGFNTYDDLYAVKPIGVLPTDTMRMDIQRETELLTEGTGSLVYENIHGAYHEAFMLFENSFAPNVGIDSKTIRSVSVDVYNAGEIPMGFSLLMKTHDGATLFAEQTVLEHQEWTTVTIDLTEYSYAQKEHLKGISLRFDVDTPATFYVDNLMASMGAADLPPVDVNDLIDSITLPEGVSKITKENFGEHVSFVEKTYYAKRLADGDSANVSKESLAKLTACLAMVEDIGVLYDARKDFVSRGYYGMNITVLASEDETYGGVWSVNIPKTNQQGVTHKAISVDGYGEVVYWLYNPMEVALTAAFHGGWSSWDLKRVPLPAQTWTKIELNARWYEYDFKGQVFFVLSGAPNIEGEFKMTSIYGISAEVIASPVEAQIEALPALSELTLADRAAVLAAKSAYNELSSSAKSSVANFEKLEDSEEKIYALEAEPVLAMIDALPQVEDLGSADRESVLQANAAYFSLSKEAKSLIAEEKVAKLNACYTALAVAIVEEKIALLPSVEEFATLDGEKYLYYIRAAKSEYDGLTEEDKAKVSLASVEKLKTLCASVEGSKILFEAGKNRLTKNGNGSDWTGEITTQTDETYGEVYLLDVQSQSTQNFDFHANGMDTEGLQRVFFYVYNPAPKDYPMVAYTADWQTSQTVVLAAGAWTKVQIPVQNFYQKGGVFYVVVTGYTLVSGWKVTCFYGSTEEASVPETPDVPETPEVPDEPENPASNVLLDASVAENLLSGRDTGNAGTVGTAKDETYGDVWTIDVLSDSVTPNQGDFHAKSLDTKGYAYVTFYVYNPTDSDIFLVCYQSNWTHVGNTVMKAKSWTKVTVDVSKATSNFFFIINERIKDGTWKVTSFLGVAKESA